MVESPSLIKNLNADLYKQEEIQAKLAIIHG